MRYILTKTKDGYDEQDLRYVFLTFNETTDKYISLIKHFKELHHFKSMAEIMPINYSLENFQIKLMQLSNQRNLMCETESVYTHVQILTFIFLLTLDSCAPFEVKLIKMSPARWITETIKN